MPRPALGDAQDDKRRLALWYTQITNAGIDDGDSRRV